MPMPKKGEPNKSEFIRKYPNATVDEIVAKAKAAGLDIDARAVGKIRSRDSANKVRQKRTAAKGPTTATTIAAKKKPAAPAKSAVSSSSPSTDMAFRRLVLTLGLGRAQELVAEVETKLAALIAGR